MEIIFHIGFHKTGSSSIQKFLHTFREKLMKSNILYPNHGIVGSAHHGIIWTLKPSTLAQFYRFEPDHNIFQKILTEARETDSSRIILSSEFFSNLSISDINLIKTKIGEGNFRFVIIMYIRRQDTTIESLYRQVIKAFESREKSTFYDYSKRKWVVSLLDYNQILSMWKQVFEEAMIIVRIYNREFFPDGNVILDFLSILQIDLPEVKKYKFEANPSLSHLSALVMRKINEKYNLTPEEHGKCIQYLLKLDREEGSPIKTFFTLQERVKFLEHFWESNEKLFREWFNSENKFLLSEDEIKFYEEQDKISREEIEKMVEERYRKVMNYLAEEKTDIKVFFHKILKPEITYFENEKIEFQIVDTLQFDLLSGHLIIGGLVLKKRDLDENLNLTAKADGNDVRVEWKIASPMLSSKFPDNPYAKDARFKISLTGFNFKIVEIMLDDVKIIEIKFS